MDFIPYAMCLVRLGFKRSHVRSNRSEFIDLVSEIGIDPTGAVPLKVKGGLEGAAGRSGHSTAHAVQTPWLSFTRLAKIHL